MSSEKGMSTNVITKEKHLLMRQQPNARIRFVRLVRWEAQVSAQPARVFDLVVQDRDSRGMKFAPVAGKESRRGCIQSWDADTRHLHRRHDLLHVLRVELQHAVEDDDWEKIRYM